ncbi:MAG: hypothetical protein IPK58_09185 [Acidobacteria bacterium]|nr:hypothetical protein [Acidobacteriota bacterium]
MKNHLSDEKLDQILKTIVEDARFNDQAVDEIANSPQLWWGVQRRIVGQKPVARFGWLPSFDLRLLAFASLALVAFLGFAWMTRSDESLTVAKFQHSNAVGINFEVPTPQVQAVEPDQPALRSVKTVSKRSVTKRPANKAQTERRDRIESTEQDDVKSDFIALMYSSDEESGQLVKVKVPRSMMVSLGVSMNVQNGSEFVNAEVLMGGDGSARAIRFIQ